MITIDNNNSHYIQLLASKGICANVLQNTKRQYGFTIKISRTSLVVLKTVNVAAVRLIGAN